MSSFQEVSESDDVARSRSIRLRRSVLLVAGGVLAVAIALVGVLIGISHSSGGEVSVLIGTLGSDRLAGLASIAGLSSLALALCIIPVRRSWLILLVPARLTAIAASCLAAAAWWLTASATVVPLLSAGCETGYVVKETSFLLLGSGTVYRTDGIFVTAVESTGGDDGYHPFEDGAYAVVDSGGSLSVWYNFSFDPAAAPVSTSGQPAFTLPKLAGRSFSCGVSTGARSPQPTAPAVPVYDIEDAQTSMGEMVGASLAAAIGPVHDANGAPVDPLAVTPVILPCDEGGARLQVALELVTADNETSLARILGAWDAAGYAPDRAMQEDIRYSQTLPIEMMTVRDSSSIDGLIRMQITSRCSAVSP